MRIILQIADMDQDIPEVATLEEFIAENDDTEIRNDAIALSVGESFNVGGGAAPLITIRRIL